MFCQYETTRLNHKKNNAQLHNEHDRSCFEIHTHRALFIIQEFRSNTKRINRIHISLTSISNKPPGKFEMRAES